VPFIIDRSISSLAYGGLSETLKYLSDRIGIDVHIPNVDTMRVLVELRNVAVHNRGYINRVYLSRAPRISGYPTAMGERYFFGPKLLEELTQTCFPAAIDIDEKVCAKFGIRRKRFETWQHRNKEFWDREHRHL
jgi:hypothetical protein